MTRSPLAKLRAAALDRQTHVLAQIAGGSHPLARGLIEGAHLVVGMGEDDAAAVRRGLPVAVPAVDQIVARLLACLGLMHHAVGAIGIQRFAGPAGRQIARGVALPVLALTANLADFRAAMALMDRAERRAGLDGLQLPDIADQHDLRAGFCGMRQHALQLARADHARLVDHQNIAAVSRSRPCSQPCSMLAMVRDAMPDPLSRFSAAIPDSATPRTS